MRALAVAAASFALVVSVRAATLPGLTPAIVAFWDRVGQCETGGVYGHPLWNWGALHRPGEGHRYEGGVGFAATTWTAWATELGLERRYPHAYLAPRLVQITVAQFGYVVHHGYWGSIADGCA